MENEDRIKALNIFFTATWISIIVSMVLAILFTAYIGAYPAIYLAVFSPVATYIIGRILCFKEYKDETT